MKYNLSSLTLTADAIDYMTKNSLVMRNSYTDQVESLHYGRNNKTDAHNEKGGMGRFSVPLWTISYPLLLQDITDEKPFKSHDSVWINDDD